MQGSQGSPNLGGRAGAKSQPPGSPPPNLSGLTGGEPTLPNAQVLGEQVQGKPSSANPRRGRNHGGHLGMEAGVRVEGKRKFTGNYSFFFLFFFFLC